MARPTEIKIVEVSLPSGKIRWDVKGTVDGKRYRKRYSNELEAKKALDILKNLHEGVTQLPNRVQTTLKDTQVRDAEAAFRFLEEHYPGKTLAWLTNEFSHHYQADLKYRKLDEAIDEYIDELKSRGTAKKYYSNINTRLKHMKGWFARELTSNITGKSLARNITALAAELELKPETIKHYAAAYTSFFKWAAHPDRCYYPRLSANPGHSVTIPQAGKTRQKKREILTVEQTKSLISFAETHDSGACINIAALAVFAGIRPDAEGEIVRLAEEIELTENLSEIIDLNNDIIHISTYVSKTGLERKTVIQPALKAILQLYPISSFPLIKPGVQSRESYFQRHWYAFKEALTNECGFKIPHDGLRHSFCSYLAMKLGSAYDVAMQAGNSETILKRHYLQRVSKEQANDFWAIRPGTKK
jgi:site-specific recombinase XerD